MIWKRKNIFDQNNIAAHKGALAMERRDLKKFLPRKSDSSGEGWKIQQILHRRPSATDFLYWRILG